jgi:hypothetical protein
MRVLASQNEVNNIIIIIIVLVVNNECAVLSVHDVHLLINNH